MHRLSGQRCLTWFLPIFLLLHSASSFAGCGLSRVQNTQKVAIKYVIDGDTVVTRQGKKIRLIGIDTPELGRKGKPREPYATKAKQQLQSQIQQSNDRITIALGSEPKDQYGRILAHGYFANGDNISQWMLEKGLAVVLVYSPNDQQLSCYLAAERQAQTSGLGLWRHSDYAVKDVGGILNHRFNRVSGKITNIRRYSNQLNISIDRQLSVKIFRDDWQSMPKHIKAMKVGDLINVRGDIHKTKKGYVMRIRHAYALSLAH